MPLPAETERVWNFLKDQPALAGFTLIGGTALTLHLDHRISEDLDIIWVGDQLPRPKLDGLRRLAAEAGFEFEENDDEAAWIEFEVGGMDLHDYQQDFLVNGVVKVTFFVADQTFTRILDQPADAKSVRLASLKELFKSKALVSAKRSRTRDWFDLHWLMTREGFSVADYRSAFREAGIESHSDLGFSRLCGGKTSATDEGFAHLREGDSPTVEEMAEFFKAERERLEQREAEDRIRGVDG